MKIQEENPMHSQIGGSHYSSMKIQPAEYIHANGINFLAGAAIKYASRYKSKNGEQDLDKAIHCLQLLKHLEYGNKS